MLAHVLCLVKLFKLVTLICPYLFRDDESETSSTPASNTDNLPAGSKLRVKYGKGKNTREYEAKVGRNYLTHNNCPFCMKISCYDGESTDIN